MKEQAHKAIKILSWIAIVLFSIRCFLSIESIMSDFSLKEIFSYAGQAVTLAVISFSLYEKFLWRINPFEKMPKLSEEYGGTLKSTYDDIERVCKLEVVQSLLSIQIVFYTGESKSKSISASFKDGDLIFCYHNVPNAEVRERSPIHYGTAILCAEKKGELCGQYFTDRLTRGDLKLSAVEKKRKHHV